MSDFEQMDEEEFGRELRASIGRLETDGSAPDDVRARASARMHAAHAARSIETSSSTARSAGADDHPVDHELLVAIADDEASGDGRRRTRRPWMAAAAAGIAVVIALGLVLAGRGDDPAPVDQPDTSGVTTVPRLLGAGTLTTDVLGPSLTFEAGEPLWLTRADEGIVRLELGPPESGAVGLTILRPGPISSELGVRGLQELLERIPGVGQSSSSIAGSVGFVWQLPPLGATSLCDGGVCPPLFESPTGVTLPTSGTADVYLASVAGVGEVVVIAEVQGDQRLVAPPGGRFSDLVEGFVLDEADPTAAPPSEPTVVRVGE